MRKATGCWQRISTTEVICPMLTEDILTSRLRIRSYTKADRDFVLALWGDEENGYYMIDPTRAHQDERYLAAVDEMADERSGYSLVAELRENGLPVGTCCAFPEGDNYDIGYCIHKAHWREGLGTEMVSALIDWIRARGGRSVTGEVADENAASVALVRKLGFAPDRKTRYKKWGEERYFDAHYYKLELR